MGRYTIEPIDGDLMAVLFGGEEVCIASNLKQAAAIAAEWDGAVAVPAFGIAP